MSVLFFSPGFPDEMPFFTAGLAEVGARVVGLGDQPAAALPERARRALSGYIEHPRWGTLVVSVLSRGVKSSELDRIIEALAAMGG